MLRIENLTIFIVESLHRTTSTLILTIFRKIHNTSCKINILHSSPDIPSWIP
jgi:hypothetical protein